MLRGRRALNLQFAAFLIFIAALLVLSRFFPVVQLIASLQAGVAHWGPWGGVVYPLLFALCNLLLLPGGILCVGSGFLFGLWWGFFLVLIGNVIAAAIAFG